MSPGRGKREWILRLFVAGHTARSAAALKNLENICQKHLAGRYTLEVVDLMKRPDLARADEIVALPTLVRRLPPPLKKIIGDLSSEARVLVGLDLEPRVEPDRDAT
jgi:circadian clock protein KaiB